MTDTDRALYKTASSSMTKKAIDFSKINLSDDSKAAIVGALAGGGLGALSHLITPKDEDENQGKRLLSNVLFGAAMGGVAGYGGKKLYDNFKPAPATKDPWVERHLDPDVSTVFGATSVGAGGVAAKKWYNSILARLGGEEAAPLVRDGRFVPEPGLDVKGVDRSVRDAYSAFDESMAHPLRRTKAFLNSISGGRVFDEAGKAQRAADDTLAKALYTARNNIGGSTLSPPASSASGIKGFFKNPRRIINAAKHSKGAGRAAGVSAAAALAALIVSELGKNPQ